MVVIYSFKMLFSDLSFLLRVTSVVIFLPLIITTAENNGNSMTDSLQTTVTNKITELSSKLDALLISSRHQCYRFEPPTTDNMMCSLNSRVIQLENEIDTLKSSSSVLPTNPLSGSGNTIALISELRSEIENLQNSFAEERSRTKNLEERIQKLSPASVPSEVETEDNTCNLGDSDIKNYGRKPLVYYLQRISFNIFLRKPSNASSFANANHVFLYALDGDFSTLYHSKHEPNPWFFVDLEVPHLIWEIRLTLREVGRAAMKVYVANDVTFDYYGNPEVSTLPVFATQVGNSASLTMTLTHPGGMCGRYVILQREVAKEHLIFYELQGIGYIFK